MAAFIVLDNIFPGFNNFVFSWDVAKNTFGPEIKMTDPNFEPYLTPVFALDTKTNTAVLAGDVGCIEGCSPDIGLVDLASGEFSHFQGLGVGSANGLAVDSEDGIACTTTAEDANVQFYDLKTKTGFTELLPGATNGRIQSGTDVEYDPIHKLFLVGQPFSSTAAEGSSIQVYDPKGNLVESVNGFGSSTLNLSFSYIALLPKQRSGFVGDSPGPPFFHLLTGSSGSRSFFGREPEKPAAPDGEILVNRQKLHDSAHPAVRIGSLDSSAVFDEF